MNSSSAYESRARSIHNARYVDNTCKETLPAKQYWDKHVHCPDDIKTFYRLYYPALPEVLVDALTIHIQEQIEGKIPPSEQFYKKSKTNKDIKNKKWDYKEDIQREKLEGQIKLSMDRLEELTIEEEKKELYQQKKKKK